MDTGKGFFALGGILAGVVLLARLFGPVFKLTNLIINPPTVHTGDTVTISVTIKNIGRQKGTKQVTLRVISTLQKSITLNPREEGVLQFDVIPGDEGTYQVSVDGLAGSFTAIATGPEVQVPAPIYGRLAPAQQRLAQFQDMSAVLYQTWDYPVQQRVIINSAEGTFDYEIPNAADLCLSAVTTALVSKTDLHILWKPSSYCVNRYTILPGQGLVFVSQIALGDSNSSVPDMIRLANGKLVVAWHERVSDPVNNSLNIGFAYTDSAGNWYALPYVNVASPDGNWGNPASRGALGQNYDGSIWYFWARDGFGCLWAIKLLESGETINVAKVFNPLIPEQDILPSGATVLNHFAPDGELPPIRTHSMADGLLVGYPRNWDRVFGTISWFSYINVIKLLPDGSYSLVQETTGRSERTDDFAIGEDWVAYGRYNSSALTWNDLVLETVQGITPLGTLKGGYSGALPSSAVFLHGSKYWVVAEMDDGYMRFFKISGE